MDNEYKFNSQVFIVLEKIGKQLFPSRDNRIISYHFNLDITRQDAAGGFIREKEILEYLQKEKVIKQTKEPEELSIGQEFTHQYKAFIVYYFEVSDKFEFYYKRYKILASSKRTPSVIQLVMYFPQTKKYKRLIQLANMYELASQYTLPQVATGVHLIRTHGEYNDDKFLNRIENLQRSFNRIVSKRINKKLKFRNGYLLLE